MIVHRTRRVASAAGWLAVCSCGWEGAWHRAWNSAEREAREHRRAMSAEAGRRARP